VTTPLRGKYREFATDKFRGEYWNSNGYATAVVAVVSPGINWAAYIGGGPDEHEIDCLEFVASSGAKLREDHARHFFPEETLPYRN